MLGYIFEKTTAIVSETVDVVADVGNYIIEDVSSIPDAISKGWDDGIFTSEEPTEEPKPSSEI